MRRKCASSWITNSLWIIPRCVTHRIPNPFWIIPCRILRKLQPHSSTCGSCSHLAGPAVWRSSSRFIHECRINRALTSQPQPQSHLTDSAASTARAATGVSRYPIRIGPDPRPNSKLKCKRPPALQLLQVIDHMHELEIKLKNV